MTWKHQSKIYTKELQDGEVPVGSPILEDRPIWRGGMETTTWTDPSKGEDAPLIKPKLKKKRTEEGEREEPEACLNCIIHSG